MLSCYSFFPASLDDAQGWMDRLRSLLGLLERVGVQLGQIGPGDHSKQPQKDQAQGRQGFEDVAGSTPRHKARRESGNRCPFKHLLPAGLAVVRQYLHAKGGPMCEWQQR